MGKMNCLINIHDMHLVDGNVERSKTTAMAQICGDRNCFVLKYDEPSPEMQGCHTEIRVTESKCVEIIRTGSYNTAMKIEKGKHNVCCYSTPVGDIHMGFRAKEILTELDGKRLKKIEFTYEIDTDGNLISKNKIRIIPEYKED